MTVVFEGNDDTRVRGLRLHCTPRTGNVLTAKSWQIRRLPSACSNGVPPPDFILLQTPDNRNRQNHIGREASDPLNRESSSAYDAQQTVGAGSGDFHWNDATQKITSSGGVDRLQIR